MNCEKEFESLEIVLCKMKEQYTDYKDTLVKQRAAIITNNITELTEILSKIDSLNENINRLDNRRAYNTDILSANVNLKAKTISEIAKAYPEYNSTKLENIALELKKEAIEVKRISDSNTELLAISQNIIKQTMKTIMLQDVDPRDRAWRTYGNSGAYSRTVRREPVHIVNRRG